MYIPTNNYNNNKRVLKDILQYVNEYCGFLRGSNYTEILDLNGLSSLLLIISMRGQLIEHQWFIIRKTKYILQLKKTFILITVLHLY